MIVRDRATRLASTVEYMGRLAVESTPDHQARLRRIQEISRRLEEEKKELELAIESIAERDILAANAAGGLTTPD